jgi:hypothetical protein
LFKKILQAAVRGDKWLWLLPDALINAALLDASEQWRQRHGLSLPQEITYIDLRYHDVLHVLCGMGPSRVGEGMVDALQQGVEGDEFNPSATYLDVDWVDYEEDLMWCYALGRGLHPVIRRIINRHLRVAVGPDA